MLALTIDLLVPPIKMASADSSQAFQLLAHISGPTCRRK